MTALALGLGLASSAGSTTPVWAGNPKQPASKAESSPPDVATDLARRGIDAINRHDFDAACRLLRQSLDLRSSVKVLLNLAVAELNAGRALEAAEHFRSYILAPDAAPDRVQTVREELLPKAYAEIGRLAFDVPDGTSVRFDGKPAIVHPGEDNAMLRVPGPVHLELPDGRFVDISVEKGRVYHIVFPGPLPSSKAVPASDDHEASAAPAHSAPAKVQAPPVRRAAPQEGGAEGSAPGSSGSAVKPWVLAGGAIATVACAAVGAGFTLAASSEDDQASQARERLLATGCLSPATPELALQCSQLQDHLVRAGRDRDTALGLYVGAGVIGVATLVTWILWPSEASQDRSSALRPKAPVSVFWAGGAHALGMRVQGAF